MLHMRQLYPRRLLARVLPGRPTAVQVLKWPQVSELFGLLLYQPGLASGKASVAAG